MTRRKTLESALARAEADLQRAVKLLAADNADRGAARDILEKHAPVAALRMRR